MKIKMKNKNVNCEWYCFQIEVTSLIILSYSVVNDARYECPSC